MARFYQGDEWRWVVLAILDPSTSTPELRIATFLDGLALNAAYDRVLNDPAVINLTVPADSPEVYLTYDDGDPLLSEGNRAIVGMRREGGSPLWVPRAAGVVLQARDRGAVSDGAGVVYTDATAMDGWQILYRRPVCNFDGSLPSADVGLKFVAEPVDNIVLALLFNTEAAHGPTFIDSSALPGNELPAESITFERGLTVGEAWKALCDAGFCDIRLDPVLDLGGGFLWQLVIETEIGVARYDVSFAWDAPGRSLATIDRLEDGTLRTNKVQEYNGSGGPPLPLLTNNTSILKYGESWLVKAQAKQTLAATSLALAQTDLDQRAFGVKTISVSPMAERASRPLLDYDIGDAVPIASSGRALRAPLDGAATWRITRIPVRLSGGALETVESLEVTSDEVLGT